MTGQPNAPSLQNSLVSLTTDYPLPNTTDRAERTSRNIADDFENWPSLEWPDSPIRMQAPSRREMFKLRALIVLATLSLVALLIWVLGPSRIGDPVMYIALTLALVLRAICLLFEWFTYWVISVPKEMKPRRKWTVDILTTACPGEPTGMIIRTLKAMVAVRYPHKNYLCDEGNDRYLKRICDELGVIHVTRKEKKHAKAGNINNALKQATGQIVVILDPDHEPAPYLLDRTLGYFEDPAVGFVQSVQAYRNQKDSFVALAAAEQSYHFYGPFMMGTNGHDTTQAIGANCVFRRAALDSIGGHAAGLAEDMHTTMRLYSRGWRSIYLPEILTRGLTPSTLAAFFKQQIKWACGSFDLLFQEYPHLFRSFTLRQKLHYLLCPLFFLRGVIVLLEMAVPVICLTYGLIAWRAPFLQIAAWVLPMVIFGTLVRLRAQRWLMEPHERGMHFSSGVLTVATWWVYLIGVACAVFRVKVPYIPTSKDDTATDAWRVSMPNFTAAGILFAAVIFGLYRDSSPSAWSMAVLAAINAFALIYVSIISQQVTVRRVWQALEHARNVFRPAKQRVAGGTVPVYHGTLRRIREGSVLLGAVVLATLAGYFSIVIHPPPTETEGPFASNKELDAGGFYTGMDLGDIGDAGRLERVSKLEKQLDFHFRIVSLDLAWGDPGWFPTETFKQLRREGTVPLINWLPTLDPLTVRGKVGPRNRAILKSINDGRYDDYLRQFADKVRAFGEPLLITFAPQADNPQMPWSTSGGNNAADFVSAWRRITNIFDAEGAANAGWVWNPASAANMDAYFPGEGYVDWIGLSMADDDISAKSFADRYEPFRSSIANWRLPVMLTDLSTIRQNGVGWLQNEMPDMDRRYPQIKAVIFKDGDRSEDAGLKRRVAGAVANHSDWADNPQDLAAVQQALKSKPFSAGGARSSASDQPLWFDLHPQPHKLTSIEGGSGHFSLTVDGAPYYIKGIAYNPSHDWHDASLPLSRTEIDTDFSVIRKMGGNTVRRYGESWSDRSIFDSAADHHLKVLYGFWFLQDVNYLTDTGKEQAYRQQIESTVLKYRNHPGLLGWSLGNEVWGLLKHRYAKPYLTEERHAHVLFVERMARLIKELDPNHPVFCTQESQHIGGAVSDYAGGAPSLDVISVNGYYQADISNLDQIVTRIDPSRPYLVSEFGPNGYWDQVRNQYDRQSGLLEDTAVRKAGLYAYRWREYIQANMGRNIGGVAYCWSDRYEGTSTWFGMIDLYGHPKPVIAALTNAWQSPDPGLGGDFPYDGPKILGIDYPSTPQWPHEPFTVKADVDLHGDDHPFFRWTVTGPGFNANVGRITPLNNGELASIELPATAGWYRIQLKVVGKSGLDEANVPVLVKVSDSTDLGKGERLAENASILRH
jgi:cellulose synthase/poly-beta-1,6-N-acetylglucosamine synthase-like glycosyltransferase